MRFLIRLIGSLTIAVTLLVAIAAVLAWGTFYEVRFGTASVQRFIYQSWWFQALLGFLGVNLAVAALQRWPWKRKHLPFVLAHVGILLVLAGAIVGGKFGVEGSLVIPEGETSRTLQIPSNVLAVYPEASEIHWEFTTHFQTAAWNHHPHALFSVPSGDPPIQVVVDRYYPHAVLEEEITGAGPSDNPAVQIGVSSQGQEQSLWLLARDVNRFGASFGEGHLFFLAPQTQEGLDELLGKPPKKSDERGMVQLEFADLKLTREIPVPRKMNRAQPVAGTSYTITFKDYFSDFAISEAGPVNQSDEPRNPAVSFTLSGPEGTDAHLLFAFHPEFASLHGRAHKIHAHAAYRHPAAGKLPPNAIAVVAEPSGGLFALLIDAQGLRQVVKPLAVGQSVSHEGLGLDFKVAAHHPRALVNQQFVNRDNEIKAEAVHLMIKNQEETAQAWLALGGSTEVTLKGKSLRLEYRPAARELPFAVKLLDFRKTDYPGTQMAAAFESDVELSDPSRGLTMKRKINMNNPLKHRGYSLFQSSYFQGPVETTVLSVRNDPGTPFVYLGFLVIVGGVGAMFTSRKSKERKEPLS